jgi:hypothetical protein
LNCVLTSPRKCGCHFQATGWLAERKFHRSCGAAILCQLTGNSSWHAGLLCCSWLQSWGCR